ncbi:MAG TPA: DUF4395 family protein [Chloroflexota bacterium]|jgi:hypothetical protein|nr:DUF4395 family protein [Chloroflexota bacterium]
MDDELFDVTARKFHQWGVVLLSALAFALDGAAGGLIMLAVGLLMVIGRFRDEADLLRGFYRAVLARRGVLRPRMVAEDRATRRIARVVGGTVQLLAALLLLTGQAAGLAWALVGLIAFMIVLDAAFDFCVLCFVVHQLRRATA